MSYFVKWSVCLCRKCRVLTNGLSVSFGDVVYGWSLTVILSFQKWGQRDRLQWKDTPSYNIFWAEMNIPAKLFHIFKYSPILEERICHHASRKVIIVEVSI